MIFGSNKEEAISTEEKSIEEQLIQDLRENENDEQNPVSVVDPVRPVLDLDHNSVKSAYKIKKRIQLYFHSKNVPLSIRPKLSHLAEATDREAEIVKRVFDRYGTDNLDPKMIEMINKYINTPLWPFFEMEFALNEKMKADIALICEEAKS